MAGILAGALAVLLAGGCGGSVEGGQQPTAVTTTPKATSSRTAISAPGPAPAGYQWVGTHAQGVQFAVPRSWATVNLGQVSVNQAIRQFTPKGLSVGYLKAALTVLGQQHGVFVADLASITQSVHHFASNVNAFCRNTALVPSPAEIPMLKSIIRSQYSRISAHVLALGNTTIHGDLAIRAVFSYASATGTDISEIQYNIFDAAGRECAVTMTTDNLKALRQLFNKIASTIRVY